MDPDPERLLGCLIGGAIGDALGAPIEGLSREAVHERYGENGLSEYAAGILPKGAITDETQLTMFTAQAMLHASVRERAKGIGGAAPGMAQAAYVAWLKGQDGPEPGKDIAGGGWLVRESALMSRRGPGRTVVEALRKAAERQKPGNPLGTPEKPINGSKGSGGVVRAAPCGFGTRDAVEAFRLGRQTAALTHGHPTGQLPAGVLAATVWYLLRGADLTVALERARDILGGHDGHHETGAALEAAHTAAPETLGQGWTADEALAIAVHAALSAEATADHDRPHTIGRRGLLLAVNHSGDSDATGSLCGNLLGARHGTRAFPGHWQSGLEARGAIVRMAADCTLEYGPDPPAEPDAWGAPPQGWPPR